MYFNLKVWQDRYVHSYRLKNMEHTSGDFMQLHYLCFSDNVSGGRKAEYFSLELLEYNTFYFYFFRIFEMRVECLLSKH